MTFIRPLIIVTLVLLTNVARAQDAGGRSLAVPDMVYKGIVGKALDAVPMDSEKRVVLQRANAVVSNTLTGRSLAAWAGLSNPILLVAGVAWGIYSAINIKAAPVYAKPDAIDATPSPAQVARAITLPAAGDAEYAECLADTATTEVAVFTEAETYDKLPLHERVAAPLSVADLTSLRF
jgi:hypothetical protein